MGFSIDLSDQHRVRQEINTRKSFTDCYKKVAWQFYARHKHKKLCKTPLVHTEDMQAAIVQAVNRVVGSKADIIDLCKKALNR